MPLSGRPRRMTSPIWSPFTSCATSGERTSRFFPIAEGWTRVSTFSIRRPGSIVAAKRRRGEARIVRQVGVSRVTVKRVADSLRLRHIAGPHHHAVAALNLGGGPVPLVIGSGHSELFQLAAIAGAQSLTNFIKSQHQARALALCAAKHRA